MAVEDLVFDWSSRKTAANGTDNFPITWAADGHQYTMGGDGRGFQGGDKKSLSLHRITGTFPGTGVDLWSGDGKSYGILALDGHLYAWRGPGSGADSLRETWLYRWDLGGKLIAKKKLFNYGDGISMPTFLQLGRNNEFAFDNFIYAYAPYATKIKWEIWETDPIPGYPDDLGIVWLMRVPRNRLMDVGAYQFWTGNGWSTDIKCKAPVVMPHKVSVLSVTYNPGLNRYLMITEHTHQQRGNMQVWDASRPWGPWRRVNLFTNWGGDNGIDETTFFWNFAPAWWSRDGKSGVMVYTGIGSNDRYNAIRVRLRT